MAVGELLQPEIELLDLVGGDRREQERLGGEPPVDSRTGDPASVATADSESFCGPRCRIDRWAAARMVSAVVLFAAID